jgi:hypothetical protein
MERLLGCMASSIVTKAKHVLERAAARSQRERREKANVTALAVSGVAGLGVTVGAAFADQKLGSGHQWKVGPIPGVAIAGLVVGAPAFFLSKYPIAQAAAVSAGGTAINLALYRYLVEEQIAPGT